MVQLRVRPLGVFSGTPRRLRDLPMHYLVPETLPLQPLHDDFCRAFNVDSTEHIMVRRKGKVR